MDKEQGPATAGSCSLTVSEVDPAESSKSLHGQEFLFSNWIGLLFDRDIFIPPALPGTMYSFLPRYTPPGPEYL
jgi:hypothetical protein